VTERATYDRMCEDIHKASIALLNDPGVRIEHDAIRHLLLRNGAKPGGEAHTARIPAELVADALARSPRKVTLADRRERRTVLSATGASSVWSSPGMNLLRRGSHRPFASADMADHARLLDQLESVDVVFGMSLDDVPPPARDVVGLRIVAENSSKHVRVLCFSPEGAEVITEMRRILGDDPWLSLGFTAHGPLRWTNLALEIFRRTAGHAIPVTVNGEPMAGASGPVTLAGSAAVGNAEILAGIVVNQLMEPGRPCIYNLGLAHVMDMRSATVVTGGPENALFAQISAAMGRRYALPSASWVSTESMCCDAQAGLEKMFGFAAHIAAGSSCVWGVGQLESELTVSPAMAVMDDEMVRYVRRFQQGVTVNAETLALDVIRDVGIGGSFLDHVHTLENFRKELFLPRALLRDRRERWRASGARTLAERAEEIADELIGNPVETDMTEEQARAMRDLAERFVKKVSG